MEKARKEKDIAVNTAEVFKPRESSRFSANPAYGIQLTMNYIPTG